MIILQALLILAHLPIIVIQLLLQDILENAGELTERAPYEDLVTTEFAKKAAK